MPQRAPNPRSKLVESKPDHKATKAAKKVPQRDGMAKQAAAMAARFR
jgi:hypothetical protein